VEKYQFYTTFDKPVPYWAHSINFSERNTNNCLMIYPIIVKDMYDFYNYAPCLLTEHQAIPDVKILSMTTYEYLFNTTFINGLYVEGKSQPFIYMFVSLLSLVLNSKKFTNLSDVDFNIMFNQKDINNKPAFMINGVLYDSDDFDEIKEIIAEQNGLELPNLKKSKKFRDAVAKAKKMKQKMSGNSYKPPTLEEQMICLAISTNLSFKDIENLTIRKFDKALRFIDQKLHYEIYLSASMSGFVEFKDKSVLKHWTTSLENKDENEGILLDMGEFENKISPTTS
jgi:hypothetical protein